MPELAAGIRTALADPGARAESLARGPALVAERFTPTAHAAAVVQVYRGLLEGGSG